MYPSLLCFLLVILGCNKGTEAWMSDEQLQEHVRLAADVKDFYRASSVFNVYNDKNRAFKTQITMFRLSRCFSSHNVLVQSLRLVSVHKYLVYYKFRTLLPLYIITLKTQLDLDEFSKFARNFSMSLNLWLVFIYRSPDLLRFCKNPEENLFNVLFDTRILVKCENDSIIREWYSLRGDGVKVNDVASWNTRDGFVMVNHHSMWVRRNTLDGIKIRIATVRESAFFVAELERNRGTLYGLFGSVLRELADVTNFTAELVATEDAYGSYAPESGNWSGVIGRLVAGEVDIGVAEFGRSKLRLEVVDFTVPLLLTRMNLYLRQPNMTAIMWFAYTQVLDTRIWSLNLLLMLICSFLIALMMPTARKRKILSLAADNFFHIFGIQCQQALPEFPSASSLKLAFMSLFIPSMVIYISYSATLTSYLAVFSPSLPFSSEQEFLADRSYNLTVLRGSVYHDVFRRSNDALSKQMRNRMKRSEDLPVNMLEAIDQVCKEKVVLCTNEVFVDKIGSNLPCQLMGINTGRLDTAAFVLVKQSPYRGLLNYYIENFRAFGMVKVLNDRHLRKFVPPKSMYTPLGFWSVVPILALFLGGVGLALFILFCEYAHHFAQKTRKRRGRCFRKQLVRLKY